MEKILYHSERKRCSAQGMNNSLFHAILRKLEERFDRTDSSRVIILTAHADTFLPCSTNTQNDFGLGPMTTRGPVRVADKSAATTIKTIKTIKRAIWKIYVWR